MCLRAALEADLPGLLALYAELNPEDPPVPDAIEVWQKMLVQPGLDVLVAEVGGMLAATCTLVQVPNLTRGARPFALLENVVTRSDFRRQGLGRMLVEEALRRAWRAGCYKVMLFTSARMPGSLEFYRSCGMQDQGKTAFLARAPQ